MQNAMFENRLKMSPQQSIQTLYDYAFVADARQRSHTIRLSRCHMGMIGALGSVITFYVAYGCIHGIWAKLSPTNQVTNLSQLVNTEARKIYRPEIYMKEKYASQIIEQKQNPQDNPLKLWH